MSGPATSGVARPPAGLAPLPAGRDGHPRIVFFIPVLLVGGAERHTVDLCERLRARGFSCRIVVYTAMRSDVITGMAGAADAVFLDLKGMSETSGWWRTWQTLRRLDPDIVVAVNQTPLIVTVLARLFRLSRARIVGIFHTTIILSWEEPTFFLYQWAARFADALVFVSRNQERYWADRSLRGRRNRVIANGVDRARFVEDPDLRAAARERLGFAEGDLVIGSVASLRDEKNHLHLVQAVAALRGRNIPARALLVGDGPMRGPILAEARRLSVEPHIVLAGEQRDVRPFIAASDVGVLCSVAVETFPLSALEFLASGIPMVLSDLGGASEIVQDGINGYLCAPGDADDLTRALGACADPKRRAALAAQARASVETLSADRMTDAYMELFDGLARAR